ncbi:hypothetical protein ANANG_G00093420 [Anguilla anguilla]|uniref:Ig-like domain-containing protein n=1 Tax=Anguilla anguilla TaxID=7936 RepID=A0A9D3MQF5_ANGAN|nr:hypothetical protein ANANG_G00093420 [Anguilla anguilla]
MLPTCRLPCLLVLLPLAGLLLSQLLIGCNALTAPRFTKVPVDQIGVSGGVVSFVCQATGDPKPRVSWNKKGKKVNSQRIETIEFDEARGGAPDPAAEGAARREHLRVRGREQRGGDHRQRQAVNHPRGPPPFRVPQHRHGPPAEGGGAHPHCHHAVRGQRQPRPGNTLVQGLPARRPQRK